MTVRTHEPLRCPVCRALVAGRERCRRCHADLRAWLCTLGWAWRLRELSRRHLALGNSQAAFIAARWSLALEHSLRGRALLLVAGASMNRDINVASVPEFVWVQRRS